MCLHLPQEIKPLCQDRMGRLIGEGDVEPEPVCFVKEFEMFFIIHQTRIGKHKSVVRMV